MKRYALITLSDKSGGGEFAAELEKLGYSILSTSNTAKLLREHCSAVTEVADLTGFPEILDGRVKTLHPAIHAGILADRDVPGHLAKLEELKIDCIDIVAVNLYPFAQTRQNPDASHALIVENIDIGGPSLIRAAAKNHRHVVVLTDPADYAAVLEQLRSAAGVPEEFRAYLARKAFALVSAYDAGIADYFAQREGPATLPVDYSLGLKRESELRYGENPHQRAAFYTDAPLGWELLHGKELSFNNHLDIDASFKALRLFERPTAVITKHCNPCGLACADELADAYRKAFAADPVSPYGGIVALNRELDRETALELDKIFTEIVIAPGFAEGVTELLKKKKNRRLIKFDPTLLASPGSRWELKNLNRGYLLQDWDRVEDAPSGWQAVTKRQPTPEEWEALEFAWKVVSLLRSNAIAITGRDSVIGLGSGQTSRIDSTFIAFHKARQYGHSLAGAVCASDGFFPFRDSIDELAKNGVMAVIQPGGSKSDPEVIEACDEHGMAMLFSGCRHFRH